MRLGRRLLPGLLVLALGAGCPGGDLNGLPDADVLVDGMEEPGGLVVAFVPKDPLPADAGGSFDAVVERVTIAFRDFRAIGDAAPGDSRTTVPELNLDFRKDRTPPDVRFPDAPPGLYSGLDGRVVRLEVRGTVVVEGVTRQYELEDKTPLDVAIPLEGVSVEPGRETRVRVELESRILVQNLDWSGIEPDEEGKLEMESDDPQIAGVRDALLSAFGAKLE